MKTWKIVYYVSTVLLSLMMLLSAGMYLFNTEMVSEIFVRLGYPTYIIYPLAAAKILGVAALWAGISETLKEWAYAGFFYDFVLALAAHITVNDGEWGGAAAALVLLGVSYVARMQVSATQRAEPQPES